MPFRFQHRHHPTRFSALQRAEIAEIRMKLRSVASVLFVSVLFNEPKLLKSDAIIDAYRKQRNVSVLFNEPKLLKFENRCAECANTTQGFSALQRAEIAEIHV